MPRGTVTAQKSAPPKRSVASAAPPRVQKPVIAKPPQAARRGYIPVAQRTQGDRARMPASRWPAALKNVDRDTPWKEARHNRQLRAWIAGVPDWKRA